MQETYFSNYKFKYITIAVMSSMTLSSFFHRLTASLTSFSQEKSRFVVSSFIIFTQSSFEINSQIPSEAIIINLSPGVSVLSMSSGSGITPTYEAT